METSELLKIILGGGCTAAVVSGIVQILLWKMNRKATKEDKKTEYEEHLIRAVRVILYDRIKYLGRHHIGEGYISAEDLEDLMCMHKCYHDDLDGNGFLDNLMKQVKALPISKYRGKGGTNNAN